MFVSNASSQLPTFYQKPVGDNSGEQMPLAAWRWGSSRALAVIFLRLTRKG